MRDKDEATPSGFGGESGPRLTPVDVQQKEFRVSFRGYNERDVDEFLDRVTEELQRYEAELMRLRSERASFDPAAFDLDDETRRILAEARERADAIVREAEARAAGIPTASAQDTRAVVAPYLNREREFLQSLGSLVQEHAQTIKTMVEEARRRTEHAPEPWPRPAAQTPASVHAEPVASGQRPSEPAAAAAGPEATELETDASPTREDEVVVLSAEDGPTADERREDDRQPEGARSLRELFWGED
jgi:DivIVA domain-containing protein